MNYEDFFLSRANAESLDQFKQIRREAIDSPQDCIELLEYMDSSEVKELMKAYDKQDLCEMGLILNRAINEMLDTQSKEDLEHHIS